MFECGLAFAMLLIVVCLSVSDFCCWFVCFGGAAPLVLTRLCTDDMSWRKDQGMCNALPPVTPCLERLKLYLYSHLYPNVCRYLYLYIFLYINTHNIDTYIHLYIYI